MTATIDSLPQGERIHEPFEFEIISVDKKKGKMTHLIDAEDVEGNWFRFRVWDTHLVYQGWREGVRYRVRESRLNEPHGNLVLSSTDDLEVELVNEEPRESIVVMSDTHLGFRNRENPPLSNSHMEQIDCVEAFEVAIEEILDIRPDSVINAGDIFDHEHVEGRDIRRFEKCLDRLRNAGILFYYVSGNHNNPKSDRTISNHDNSIHLNWKGKEVRNAVLYGVDENHDPKEWLGGPYQKRHLPQIGVFHHELTREEIEDSGLDVFIRGHFHKHEKSNSSINLGEEFLYLQPGSVDGISRTCSNRYEQDPSIWELQFGDGKVDCIKHPLSKGLKN